jgi:hypothetical protein
MFHSICGWGGGPEFVFLCEGTGLSGDGMHGKWATHLGTVSANWPNKKILEAMREAVEAANRYGAASLRIDAVGMDWVFQDAFNLFVGNGMRYDSDGEIRMMLAEDRG